MDSNPFRNAGLQGAARSISFSCFSLQEGDVRSVDVVRLDGALTTQRVQVTIHAGNFVPLFASNVLISLLEMYLFYLFLGFFC